MSVLTTCTGPRYSSATARKLHRKIQYQLEKCISSACSGSMIFAQVVAPKLDVHGITKHNSYPRYLFVTAAWNSMKLHREIKYQLEICISSADSNSTIFAREAPDHVRHGIM